MKLSTAIALFSLTRAFVSASPVETAKEELTFPAFDVQDIELGAGPESLLEARGVTVGDIADMQGALKAHNDARAKRNIKALVWDAGLAQKAQAWANELARTQTFKHNSSGENLYYRYPTTTQDLTLGTKAWLAEEPNYHNELIPQGNFASYGHYTQCLWNTTLRVGIAKALDVNNHSYVVARYDPPGNFVGRRPY